MRENFTERTRFILAGRVNYKCSFPGCGNITLGPSGISDEDVVILGEAAHIYAASARGPRANPYISNSDLRSVKNGIWLCRHHARLIDADHHSFSAGTLLLWKKIAEANALHAINNKEEEIEFTTLVSLSNDIIFEAVWVDVKDANTWTFEICRFIYGDIKNLRELSIDENSNSGQDNYICVESEGDARLLAGPVNWNFDQNTGLYTISVHVRNKEQKISVEGLGTDIELNGSGDLGIGSGDFKPVSAEDLAIQYIETVISFRSDNALAGYLNSLFPGLPKDAFPKNPFPVSFIPKFFSGHSADKILLSRLIKLDLARLVNIPFNNSFVTGAAPSPPLNFINRIIGVQVISTEIVDNKIPIKLKVEWKDGNYWQDTIHLHI